MVIDLLSPSQMRCCMPVAIDNDQPYTVAGTAPDLSPFGYVSLDSLLHLGLWPWSPIAKAVNEPKALVNENIIV